ncbi:molybdenum ABC transporter ATP-binding protein [Desulfovibrio sp. OttesenSCG-928-G11]|nr:molybdenum ABC transporter ATP-binding protein [Desulfovibrio sp. OttesenSCG-928-G11]
MLIEVVKRQGDFLLDACIRSADSGVTALFGPSGAGKSSLINMVAGLSRPDAGRIVVKGRCLFDRDQGVNLPPEARRLGCVFQEGRLFPHLSVRANLCYGMRLTPEKQRLILFEQVVELLGIGPLLERRPGKLSGGEKQRLAIGRALLISPAALLMDEPLASLDQDRKEELLPYIARVSVDFGMPILYVSHSLEEIRRLTEDIVYIRNGECRFPPCFSRQLI